MRSCNTQAKVVRKEHTTSAIHRNTRLWTFNFDVSYAFPRLIKFPNYSHYHVCIRTHKYLNFHFRDMIYYDDVFPQYYLYRTNDSSLFTERWVFYIQYYKVTILILLGTCRRGNAQAITEVKMAMRVFFDRRPCHSADSFFIVSESLVYFTNASYSLNLYPRHIQHRFAAWRGNSRRRSTEQSFPWWNCLSLLTFILRKRN